MATRQLYTAETMFVDDGITDGFQFPSSSNAIYDALADFEVPKASADSIGGIKVGSGLSIASDGTLSASGGGGGGVFAVHAIYDDDEGTTTLDKTWQEIYDAMASGQIVNIFETGDGSLYSSYVWEVRYYDEFWNVNAISGNITSAAENFTYRADNEDGYPVLSQGD